ncbi:uncharacterized protein LAESUDRAFT_699216 [Laetiporus sulphureus 93-53]|uniref:BTB domain-containing protein n=1 Tax=Laetiporus sulphureus 93-53 TaxID=1314785 RepID=A0A165ELM1_9APHY|nr:uncharacterized protein LAESUDRAFT_699216 [Laetiporus sulphureus 93-53]KZT07313.1 hypothetical protein LAESUDRAFT_699216 [Laetiporus sulphureus 93-53]
MSDGMPVILIPQHSTVLLNLLRLCYPVSDPTWSNLEDIRATLQAAIKYDMTEAAELVKVLLRMHIPTAPLRVYAIACHQNLEDVARAAAEEVRRQECQSSFVPELEDIMAGQYNRLLQFCELNEFGDPTESFCYGNGPDVISRK